MKFKISTKKITAAFLIMISLTGCLGDDEDDSNDSSGLHTYGIEDIVVDIPNEWEILTSRDFSSTIGPETLVAFRSNLKHPTFTPNIVVIKSGVGVNTQTMDYAKSLKYRIAGSLIGYRDLGSDPLVVNVGDIPVDTLLIKSEGREKEQSDLKEFIHVAVIKNGIAYTVVGTLLVNADESEKERVHTIATSLKIK